MKQFLASSSAKILVKFTKNKLVKLTRRAEIRISKFANKTGVIANYFQLSLERNDESGSDVDSISGAEAISNITAELEKVKIQRLELELKLRKDTPRLVCFREAARCGLNNFTVWLTWSYLL